ncbi:MAG TPA: hydroxyisourate hydrolase [Kofleriaceae bacterium]|nr:hydroxyisourate hydrolase [Kofleriaceae bacterium]
MSAITTHVLDTAVGRAAVGVPITLELEEEGAWQLVGKGVTDRDGRLRTLLPDGQRPAAGVYRLTFDTAAYFAAAGVESFYPVVQVVFRLSRPDEHHHVPLLLSPFGYSTYRGT